MSSVWGNGVTWPGAGKKQRSDNATFQEVTECV